MRQGTAVSEGSPRPVAIRIVERVAAAKGVRCDELTPLAEVVDSDALTDLTTSLPTAGEIALKYEGFTVTVNSDGQIRLSPSP